MADGEGERQMMKKFLEKKFAHALVALAVSIGFWCYVVMGTNPVCTANLTVSNIVCDGLQELTDKGFFFEGDLPGKIDIRAKGAWKLVSKINEDYSAKIDFTGIKGAGDYTLKVKVTGPSGVEIKKVRPETINVTIDAGKTKKVGTTLSVLGKKASDYEISLIDESISASGPTSVISKIDDFKVEVNADSIDKTGKVMYKAVPLDADGNELIDAKLTYDKGVAVQIDRIKEVDIVVDESLIPTYIKELYNVNIELDRKTVKIAGEDKALDEVGKIEANLATVMLKPSENVQTAKIRLLVPENVRFAQGETETVNVSINYQSIDD